MIDFLLNNHEFLGNHSIPEFFIGLSLFFGTKGGYYDSDDYKGDGCAHDVQR